MTIRTLLSNETDADYLDTEVLLAHVLKHDRSFLITHPEYTLSFLESWKFKHLLRKRKKGVPIAYLTGHKEFFGLDFLVNKHTLIPRPDTELMVETVLEKIGKLENSKLLIIDVGTGSGCIPIAIMKTLKHKNIKTTAVDISHRALRVARKNAQTHQVNIQFFHGNLIEPVTNSSLLIANCSLFITANLPYLTAEQFAGEPTIRSEPKSALVAGNGGLELYEKLLNQIKNKFFYHAEALRRRRAISVFLEIDPSQSNRITLLIKKYFPTADVQIKTDLAGRDRLVIVHLSNPST